MNGPVPCATENRALDAEESFCMSEDAERLLSLVRQLGTEHGTAWWWTVLR